MSILHTNAAGLHALDAPGGGARQKNIARQAFHSKIFIERPHHFAFGLCHYIVVRCFGNRATGSNGCQTRASSAAHAPIYLVAMQMGSVASALCGDSIGQHGHNPVELAAL